MADARGEHGRERLDVYPKLITGLDLDWFLARFHQSGKRNIPRLIQTQVSGNDGGKIDFYDFKTGIGLASAASPSPIVE